MAIANAARGGQATNTTVSATTLSITVTASAGDTIIVAASTLAAVAVSNVTDNASGGSNKYYKMGDVVGASGRISMWISFNGKACTTITVTHAAGRASGSASTYTGVLGAGQTTTATNAANNNTITLTNAVSSGNIMVASMGDAAGTQTWTAVTGTLRNNIAGGGSTTPGATNMDTLVSGGSTLAASLSVSVSGEAVAIELFGNQQAMASEALRFESLDNPPLMWMLSPLQLLDDREQHEIGLVTPQGVGGINLMGFRGYVIPAPGMAETVDWGQNIVVATPVTNPFDAEYNPNDMQSYFFSTDEVEHDNWGWKPPTVVTSRDEVYYENDPQLQSYFVPELEDELAQWGYNVNTQGSGGTQMGGFRGFRALKAGMQDIDQWGFQTAVVAVTSAFDQDEGVSWIDYNQIQVEDDQSDFSIDIAIPQEAPDINPWSGIQVQDEDQFGRAVPINLVLEIEDINAWTRNQDVEEWAFNTPEVEGELLLEEEVQINNRPWPVIQQVEDEQFGQNAPFLQTISLDQTLDFPSLSSLQLFDQLEEMAMGRPFVDADTGEVITTRFAMVDDEIFGFQSQTGAAAILAWDAEYNPVGQISYYFNQEDLEKYNWGWMPPMTKVTEDDTPYDAQPQRSYFINEHNEEFGQSVQFYIDNVGDERPGVREIANLVEEGLSFGFGIEGVFELLDNVPTIQNAAITEDEQFGFRQQVFLGTDDSPEHLPAISMVRVDDEYFGFNTPTVTVNTAFADEDHIPTQVRTYGEDETFGFQFQMAQDQDDQFSVGTRAFTVEDDIFGHIIVIAETESQEFRNQQYNHVDEEYAILSTPFAGTDQFTDLPEPVTNIQDEERQISFHITQPFAFGDEIDHLPNPPYPITHQTEFDQVGLNAPFIISHARDWEESGVPPNQPWPVLDVTDYNDWLFHVTTSIMKIYNVSIRNVLAVLTLAAVNQQVLYEFINKYRYAISSSESTALFSISEIESHPLMSVALVLGRPQSNN